MPQGNQRTGLPVISDSSLATTIAQNSRYTLNSLSGEFQVPSYRLPYTQNPDKSEVPSYVSANSKHYHAPANPGVWTKIYIQGDRDLTRAGHST